MSAPASTDHLAGITIGELEIHDVVVLDPIYGMERILAVETLYLSSTPTMTPATLGQLWEARKLTVRDSYGRPRNVLRFPLEPCVRVTTTTPLAGEEGTDA